MSYAAKIGTAEAHWIDDAPTPPGCVRFEGEMAGDLVWGDDIQNLRAPNAQESLTLAKAARITAINTECRTRLIARFGDPAEQVSRAIGVYGLAEKTALETGIAATIDATNTASDAVAAATTIAQVEAVAVAWPVI